MKKFIVLFMAVIAVTIMPISSVSVEAAAVKMDAKSKSVEVGKTITVKLKNNKKKVQWSISNGKAQITKKTKTYAKVKGITAGNATLKAKAGKKTYKCKISIRPVISISNKTISIAEGGSGRVSLVNANAGKVTWKSSNTAVATVAGGWISAKKKGTATITATYEKKNYSCKVTVTASPNVFDAEKADSMISRSEMTVNNRLYVRLESKYEFATNISAKVNFYDKDGLPVDYNSDSVGFLEKGHVAFLKFYFPDAEYSTYKIDYEFSEGLKYFYHSSVIDKLSLTSNETEDYIMLQITNSADAECYYCEISIIFYDANKNIVDIKTESVSSIAPNSTETQKAYKPYDHVTYNDIQYESYEAFVSYAYHLGK